jgi:CRP/FNR family transcriptional regulator, cyclic AMP receptor protein
MARSTTEEMILSASGGRPPSQRQPETRARRTQRENVVALAGVPLFADFTKRHLAHLAKEAEELDFEPGTTIVEEGMLGETLFVVLSGKAKVTRGGRKVGEVLPGDFFGELSALDGGPRTASVIADTPVRVLRLFRHTLMELLRDEPQLMLKLLAGIVRRIRSVERRAG